MMVISLVWIAKMIMLSKSLLQEILLCYYATYGLVAKGCTFHPSHIPAYLMVRRGSLENVTIKAAQVP